MKVVSAVVVRVAGLVFAVGATGCEPGVDAPRVAEEGGGEGRVDPDEEVERIMPFPKVKPWVVVGDAALEGSCDGLDVRGVMREELSTLRDCHWDGLRRDEGLTGTLTLAFRVRAAGGVESIEVASSSLGDARVEACVRGAISARLFDARSEGTCAVTQSFEFVGRGEDWAGEVDEPVPVAAPKKSKRKMKKSETGRSGSIGEGADPTPRSTRRLEPRIELGRPEVEGCERADVQRAVRKNARRLKACYHREVVKNPDIEGEVVVAVSVRSDGRVSSAKSTATFTSAALGSCVEAVFERIEFPSGGCSVSYPVRFELEVR